MQYVDLVIITFSATHIDTSPHAASHRRKPITSTVINMYMYLHTHKAPNSLALTYTQLTLRRLPV